VLGRGRRTHKTVPNGGEAIVICLFEVTNAPYRHVRDSCGGALFAEVPTVVGERAVRRAAETLSRNWFRAIVSNATIAHGAAHPARSLHLQ
jgi:hypothetical protein